MKNAKIQRTSAIAASILVLLVGSVTSSAFATHYYSGSKFPTDVQSYVCALNLTDINDVGISPCNDLSGPATTWTNAPGRFELVYFSGSGHPVQSGDLGSTGTLAQAWVPKLFGSVLDADITFNKNIAVTFGNANINSNVYDYQSVALHEFGHWVAFNHASETSSVMYSSIGIGVVKRTLNAHDSSSMGTIYP